MIIIALMPIGSECPIRLSKHGMSGNLNMAAHLLFDKLDIVVSDAFVR
jgi:hypothetical protein